jgi:hypothetical protein
MGSGVIIYIYIYISVLKEWFSHSKVYMWNTQSHRQHRDRISLLSLFQGKKSRLKMRTERKYACVYFVDYLTTLLLSRLCSTDKGWIGEDMDGSGCDVTNISSRNFLKILGKIAKTFRITFVLTDIRTKHLPRSTCSATCKYVWAICYADSSRS